METGKKIFDNSLYLEVLRVATCLAAAADSGAVSCMCDAASVSRAVTLQAIYLKPAILT